LASCTLWLDAADPFNNGTSPGNGSGISTWYDKSGYGNNANVQYGSPYYNTTGLNGLPTIVMPGTTSPTNPTCFFGNITPNKGTTVTILMVGYMNIAQTAGNSRIVALGKIRNLVYNNVNYIAMYRNGKNIVPERSGASGNPPDTINSAYTNKPLLYGGWCDGGTMYATAQQGNYTTISTVGSSGNFNYVNYSLGDELAVNYTSNWNYPTPFNGTLSEVMIFSTNLSDAQRQTVEGYLSWKWGLQSNLPTSHPFYSAAFSLYINPFVNGCSISSNMEIAPFTKMGNGCGALVAASSQNFNLANFTLTSSPSNANNGLPGISITGWFYPSGTQANNATVFSISSSSGPTISCYYSGTNNWLTFNSNPGTTYIAWSFRVIPNAWNFIAYSIVYNSAGTSGNKAIHNYYLNGVRMNSIIGAWTVSSGTTTFDTNKIGYGSGLGYFNGFVDEFRVYKRALSPQDIRSMWWFGINQLTNIPTGQNYGNLIDTQALQIYYPCGPVNVCGNIQKASVSLTSYSAANTTQIALVFTGSNSAYYVSIARNTGGTLGSASNLSTLTYSYTDSGLNANTVYSYVITPYNELNVVMT